jgi:hypothetical protein
MSDEVFASEAFAMAVVHAQDMAKALKTRTRDEAFLAKYRALVDTAADKPVGAVEGLAIIATVALILLIEESEAAASSRDDWGDALDQGERYRLAWQSARRRSQDLRIHAETVETERDGLRQALHDWIAGSDDEQVEIVRAQRDAALRDIYTLQDELRESRQQTVAVAGRFDDVLDRLQEVLVERDEARAEAVRLGRELEGWHTAANDTIRSLPTTPGGGDPS